MVLRVRVKIAVAVDEKGNWSCAGWGGPEGATKDELRQMQIVASDCLEPRGAEVFHWVVADVPIPVEQTVEGEVEPVEDRTSEQSGAEHGSSPATET